MSELGSHAAVGIESVEWLDEDGPHLTVRVTGRWRRRRGWVGSEARGPTMLVIEVDGHRHRFPAMPEPPSLAGVAPGTWRLSFAVPSEFAPGRGGHAWLSLGSVTVPLPVPGGPADAGPSAPAPAPPSAEIEAAADPAPADPVPAPAPGSLEIERAWRRADDAERIASELGARIDELERALADERRDRAQAAASLAERDRRRRSAEQRAHAEEAMRRDLARQLAAGSEEAARARQAMGDLAAAEERIRGLEHSLDAARRVGDEAERAAAAAQAARERAERERALTPPVAGPERDRLVLERELRALRDRAGARVPAEPPAGGPVAPAAAVAVTESDVVRALRHELDARVAAEAGLRARVVQAETRLAARVLLEQRTTATLRELRSELDELRRALTEERSRRAAAEDEARSARAELGGQRDRSRDAYQAIGELRGALDRLAPGSAPAAELGAAAAAALAPPSSVEAVTPERLSDALARLRERREPGEEGAAPPATTPAVPPSSAVAGRATLEPTLRRLAARDPGLAGRLLVELLGAQRAVYPHPISYDLVLGPGHGCVQVTVGPEAATIEVSGAARAREQVDLQLVGDPARLARRLLAGRLRRWVPIGLARVRGRRDGIVALRALLALPLDLTGLRAAGMGADPETLLALVAVMIDPAWTRGERFTLAHLDERGGALYLQIRDGRPPLVTRRAPEGRVATELRGSAEGLLASLAPGPDRGDALECGGDRGPLQLVREWVNRAQCG